MQVNNRNSIGFKGLEFSINQYGENGKLLGPLSELPLPYDMPIEKDGYLKFLNFFQKSVCNRM